VTGDLLAEKGRLLADKLTACLRLQERVRYSQAKLPFPLVDTACLDNAQIESLSAFNETFSKWQDVLASAMKEAVGLSGLDASQFMRVLAIMEKDGVVDAVAWRTLRELRNAAAHDYLLDGQRQARHFNALAGHVGVLESATQNLIAYCGATLGLALL
jgi:hypothetical protein